LQITLSKYLASDTSVVVTIALQPVVSIVAGSTLVITVAGDLAALQAQLVTTVISPIAAYNAVSSVKVGSREFRVTFSVNISAQSVIKFSLGNFRLPSASLPGSDFVEAALLDPFGNVFAPSSTGSYPAIFASTISGSSVNLSSFVANAASVSVAIKLFAAFQPIAMLRLSGLGFVAFSGSSVGRRLLQGGISCSNLNYSGVPGVSYHAQDGELTVTFPAGGAIAVNAAFPSVCTILGFRNPAASVAAPGIILTTYDLSLAGRGIQSGVVFPQILCPSGYSQNVSGNDVMCAACPKGTYANLPGSSRCLLCPAGTYSSSVAMTSALTCSLCPAGSFSNVTGANDVSMCKSCLPGTNSTKSGSAECGACPYGTYSEMFGRLTCDKCEAGKFSMQTGAASRALCNLCPAGYFSSAGSESCTRCPPGTESKEGDSVCSKCPAGKYSPSGECLSCPIILHSVTEGSSSIYECSYVFINVEHQVAYFVGTCFLAVYLLSLLFVPAWSVEGVVMRFVLTPNFEERSNFANQGVKRVFKVGDSLMWESHRSNGAIGTVQSTSVSPEQDVDELGNFVAFIRIEPEFVALFHELSAASKSTLSFCENPIVLDSKSGKKPVLIDSCNDYCRCQLQEAPQRCAEMPIFGFEVASWELACQISACFRLLFFTVWPALDSIMHLVYILSQLLFNYYLFAASIFCFFMQFWCFLVILKRHRVLEALKQRKIELTFLKGAPWWPKWASPDSLPVFLTLIMPFYFVYHLVFPVVWFFVGFIFYLFQLFPISRISNFWLYVLVYSFAVEKDSYRRRFDSSEAIIIPIVHKSNIEHTIFESVPQLAVQLVNGYFLGYISNISDVAKLPLIALVSMSLSVLCLFNTMWNYAYWRIFRCKPIRGAPSSISLYNYKLRGVTDGILSLNKPTHFVKDVKLVERDEVLGVTIAGSVLNEESIALDNDDNGQLSSFPRKMKLDIELEMFNPDDPGRVFEAVCDMDGVDAVHLQAQLDVAREMILKLEAEKLRIAEEHKHVKQLLLHLADSSQKSIPVASLASEDDAHRQDDPFAMVLLNFYPFGCILTLD
jgi:hypothetical protein